MLERLLNIIIIIIIIIMLKLNEWMNDVFINVW